MQRAVSAPGVGELTPGDSRFMRNPCYFFSDLLKQSIRESAWVVILALANLSSVLFWASPLAKIIFITFILSAVAKLVLYSCFGMEKILAVAHIFWIYLIPFIVLQLVYAQGVFFIYLVVLVLLLVAALVIDTRNLWRYFRELRSDDALHR
jgi:hypothetical protein